MDTIYKRKINKIKSVDSDELDNSILRESKSWRENMIRKKIKNVDPDLDNLYAK
jgi:hypothetical protein